MIDNRIHSFNFEIYTDELMNNVRKELNSTNLSFYRTEESERSCYIILANKEYFIDFTFIATPGRFQLKVDIREKEKEYANQDLHELKINVKDFMIEDWEQCVWLTDHQSEELAEDLYKNVHSVENSLRRLINTVLFYNLGGDWWKLMPVHLTSKYSKRIGGYQDRAPSFKNVHANLFSIDTDDLVSILEFKTYDMKDQSIFTLTDSSMFDFLESEDGIKQKQDFSKFKQIMSDIINNKKSIEFHQKALTTLLNEQMKIDIDFWEDFFSPWFSCSLKEFSGKWNNFSNDRNHVAHNKLIDNKLHQKFQKSMDDLLTIITEAEDKFNEYLKKEATQFLDDLKQRAIEESYQSQREKKQAIAEEAGIQILDKDQIISLFQEHITETFDSIRDEIYYRTDIEITYDEPLLTTSEKIFEIQNNILKRSIHVEIDPDIDETDGYTSEVQLLIYSNEYFTEAFDISYVNGEVEFNEDQGNFMPKIEDELRISSLKEIEGFLYKLLEEEMPELDEDILASFVCEACSEYTVNISQDNDYGLGVCISCGHRNTMGECLRCEIPLDQTNDGFCESCRDWMDKQ